MKKTWKRETAMGLILYLISLSVFDILADEPTRAFMWAELLALPILAFAGAAFGLDAAIKQGGWRKSDQTPPDGFAE